MQRKHTTDGHIAVKVKQTFTLFVFIHCKQVFSIVSVLTHSFFSFLLLLNMHFFLNLQVIYVFQDLKKKKSSVLPSTSSAKLHLFIAVLFFYNLFFI